MASKSSCGGGCGGNCGGNCGGSCGSSGSVSVTTSGCGSPATPQSVTRVVTTVCTPKVKCAGRTPFMVQHCRGKIYPAGSLVYDGCGYWFTPKEEAFAPPKGEWRQLDFLKILVKLYLLQNSCCDFIFPPMAVTTSCTATDTNCDTGQTAKLWCENEVGCYNGKLYVSKKPNNIWTGVKTADWEGGLCVGEFMRKTFVLINNPSTQINYNSAAQRPSAWVRAGDYPKTSGLKPPASGVIRDELYGGFAYNAAGGLVVPKTGVYVIDFLSASIADATKLYQDPQQLQVGMLVNGTVVTARNHDDHTGNHSGEELARPRPLIASLNAGDVLNVETTEETAGNYLATYDMRVVFQSDLT